MEGRRFASEVSDISHWRIGKISDLGVTRQPGRALLTFFYFMRRGTKNPDSTETPYGERYIKSYSSTKRYNKILLNFLSTLNSKFSKMCKEKIVDFWAHYSYLCVEANIFPSKSILKKIKGTKFICLVETIRKEFWPLLLSALTADNSLSEICFFTHYSLDEQKERSKEDKKKKSNWGFPVPYGCSAKNIADICICVTDLLRNSKTLKSLRIENLCLKKDDIQSLSEGLKNSNLETLSLAGCQLHHDSVEVICKSLQSSNVELLDLSSCDLNALGMLPISDLIKAHHLRRSNDIFPDTLRYRLPVLDAMKGLRRISLNNNDVGNKGIEILMSSLQEDIYMKAFDLQKCGIGDEGAKSILNVLKSHVGLQLIDIRQNDIDDTLIDRIALQLSLNNSQKEIKYELGDLWKPKSRKIIRCKVKKVKSVKRFSPPKFGKNLSLKDRSKALLQIKKTEVKEAYSQTTFEFLDELTETQNALSHEIRMQNSLKHLVKKYKLENSLLRKELNKMAVLDDYILMDQETFMEVKNTFEKFQRFLEAMKKYGLWECLEMLDVHERTDVAVQPVITKILKKNTQLNEDKPSTSKTNGLISRNSSVIEKHSLSEQYSSQRMHKTMPVQTKIRSFKNFHELSAAKQFSETQSKVMKIYKDVCDNYSKSTHSNRAFHETNYRETHKSEIPTSDDYIKHIESFLRESGHKTFRDINNGEPRAVKQQKLSKKKSAYSQTRSIDIIHDEQKSPTISLRTDSEKIRLKENTSVSTYTSHILSDNLSASQEQSIQESIISSEYKSLPKTNLSNKSMQENKDISGEISEIREQQDHHFSKSDTSLHSKKISSDSEVTLKSSKISVEKLSDTKSHPKTETRSSQKVVEKVHVASDPSSVKSDDFESVSSVSSYNSKKIVKSGSSAGKGDVNSYLESVSDASTDKDVESLTLSEVYSSPRGKNGMKNSNEISESSKGNEVPVESIASLDEKLSNASQKSAVHSSKSKSSKSKHTMKNPQSSHVEIPPKENLSDVSIPSLSDITTVSSQSLNTNSVMDQLSE
ncbi:centrosomal protein of 78 kDa [Trichonephila clavata]|uniref:Centrosomal protein of 78 kDa n=1 Tax=Trichonephila clavata TaxID=2740835 RepID=A0A8X6GAH4_TRICU|nr:centrosomal protein of 78 kDa [Trichonephila clavata]